MDNPKADKPLYKGQSKSTIVYTLYIITSKRGQPLYSGQKAGIVITITWSLD